MISLNETRLRRKLSSKAQPHSLFQGCKFEFRCFPDGFVISAVVGVSKYVAHPAQACPIRAGAEDFRFCSQAIGGLAEDLKLTLDGGLGFEVG